MKLWHDAEFVFRLFDAVIEVSHIHLSTLTDITVYALATLIKGGQISDEAIDETCLTRGDLPCLPVDVISHFYIAFVVTIKDGQILEEAVMTDLL